MKSVMNIIKAFFGFFTSKNGAEFVGVREYESSTTGEIANHIINVGISTMNAKRKDLALFKSWGNYEIIKFAVKFNIPINDATQALKETIESIEKNLNTDVSQRTSASQAQTESYEYIAKGLAYNDNTDTLYISGFGHSKEVLKKGEHKTKNYRSNLTKAKDILRNKYCYKFRRLKIENAGTLIKSKKVYPIK